MKKVALFSVALASTPFIASAQANLGFFDTLVTDLGALIGTAIPVVIGLAVLLFLWGLARYILNQDDAEARAGARSIMIWGIVIIFVAVSIWGLVAFLSTVTGVSQDAAVDPTLVSPI